jgi:hypothetical protein
MRADSASESSKLGGKRRKIPRLKNRCRKPAETSLSRFYWKSKIDRQTIDYRKGRLKMLALFDIEQISFNWNLL